MRVKRPRVLGSAEGQEETVTAVLSLDTHHRRLEPLGVTLAEATQRLSPLQRPLRHHPVATFLDSCATCAAGGALLTMQAHASRSWRPLLGPCPLDHPRLEQGACTRPQTSACRPWSALRTASGAPARLSREAQGGSLVSSGLRLEARQAWRPLAVTRAGKTGCSDPRKVAQRLAAELSAAHPCVIAGSPSAWALWPRPAGACKGGMAGGDGRHGGAPKPHGEGMAGKRPRTCGEDAAATPPSRTRLGVGHTLAPKPQRRLSEGWHAPGVQRPQAVSFLADGPATRRALQRERRPQAPPL
jgi:hypothetical protein